MFDIDKGGKPMPDPYKQVAVYPLGEMDVGDSFDCPRDLGINEKGSDRRQHAVKSATIRHIRKNPHKEFETRCVDKNTVRCKRIK